MKRLTVATMFSCHAYCTQQTTAARSMGLQGFVHFTAVLRLVLAKSQAPGARDEHVAGSRLVTACLKSVTEHRHTQFSDS